LYIFKDVEKLVSSLKIKTKNRKNDYHYFSNIQKRKHCNIFDSSLKIVVKSMNNAPTIAILRAFHKKFEDDLELRVFPNLSKPEKIEYRNSKNKEKQISYKTFCNKVSKMKNHFPE
jgi:hypothetical protein